MKTAISIPDTVFESAERLAERMKKSRSQLYSEAVAEYLARHRHDAITERINEVCADTDTRPDDFSSEATRRVLNLPAELPSGPTEVIALPAPPKEHVEDTAEHSNEDAPQSLADLFAGHVGVIDSRDPRPVARDGSEPFIDFLEEKRRAGHL